MINEYFKNIAVVNLKKRTDRLESSTTLLNNFGVNFEVWEATDNTERPCEGLVVSMQRYFRKILSEGAERCLVFEDDIKELVDSFTWNDTMNKCIEQLPTDWDLFYLGCNPAGGIDKFYSENLLSLRIAYATHAVAYSKKAMEFVIRKEVKEPFDNFLVRDFQHTAKVFCSYPILLTQIPGHSDINKGFVDWSRFIEGRFNAHIKRLKP